MNDAMNNIIVLTDAAIKHIQQNIQQKKNSIGFRLSIKKTGCSGYMYVPEIIDKENSSDLKIKTACGLNIFIDSQSIQLLRGTEIDLVTKELGMKQLQFNNPNAESLCGCGESFNLKGDN